MATLGDRRALVYVPTSFAGGGPALVAIHGNGDSAENFLAIGLRAAADANGFAVALPIAGAGFMGVDWDAYNPGNSDVLLVDAARAHLVAGGADPKHVFLLGYSQGGYLAFHAGMVYSDRFGAVHVAGATDPTPGRGLAAMAPRHIPVDMLIGSGDFAIDGARATRDELMGLGFEVRYTELPGVGHCCYVHERYADIWPWLAARPLP